MFSGQFGQFLASIALPGALGVMLLLLPFLDRNPERNIFKRPLALIGWVVLTASILLFTVSAIINRSFLD
jgi:ubiquinol-cytochrome c reductase cytochrome b subunit